VNEEERLTLNNAGGVGILLAVWDGLAEVRVIVKRGNGGKDDSISI